LPLGGQFARLITFVQVAPVGLVMLTDLSALITPGSRPAYWSDLWLFLGGLILCGLAVTSAARLGPGRKWAWSGSFVVNAIMAIAWTAAIVWAYSETTAISGADSEAVDPGMVLVSVAFVGVPMIAISVAAVVLLVLPSVLRHCLA
jgi:hypothetical protein